MLEPEPSWHGAVPAMGHSAGRKLLIESIFKVKRTGTYLLTAPWGAVRSLVGSGPGLRLLVLSSCRFIYDVVGSM